MDELIVSAVIEEAVFLPQLSQIEDSRADLRPNFLLTMTQEGNQPREDVLMINSILTLIT